MVSVSLAQLLFIKNASTEQYNSNLTEDQYQMSGSGFYSLCGSNGTKRSCRRQAAHLQLHSELTNSLFLINVIRLPVSIGFKSKTMIILITAPLPSPWFLTLVM